MISTKDIEIFRKQFDMDGEANDQELFMALARERLRMRTIKKTCESNPVSKSICVNKETPLPQQVVGKIISRNVIGYKKGVYIGKIGIATPLSQKFIIFKEVKGYTQISTLKRLSMWCFNAQQPLKFHRNCKNFYIRETEQIWWRLSFRTDVELKLLLDIIDGVNIRLINNLPPNSLNAQVEQTKLISKITNPSIADPRLKKLAKKAAKKATKKLKANTNESTQMEADSTQILLSEGNVKPASFLLKKEIEGNSEAEVKIEPDLRPHALIGPENKLNKNATATRGKAIGGKIVKSKSSVIKMENDVMDTCSPIINTQKVKSDDSETDMETNERVAKIETKIKTANKNKKNSKQTKESKQKSGKEKKKSVAEAALPAYEKKENKAGMTFETRHPPSMQNFFGKEGFQQSNAPKQCNSLNLQTIKGTKSFLGFLNYMYQLQNRTNLESKPIKVNGLDYKKICLLLNIGLGDGKNFNFRDALFANEQKDALLCEFLKRLKESFSGQLQQRENEDFNNDDEVQYRQQFQKEYLQCLMENLKI